MIRFVGRLILALIMTAAFVFGGLLVIDDGNYASAGNHKHDPKTKYVGEEDSSGNWVHGDETHYPY